MGNILLYSDGGLGSSYPVIKGIISGSSLSAMKSTSVSCSSANTLNISSFEWFVNGRKRWEDKKPTHDSREITSKWSFLPMGSDVVIECKVKGDQDQSTFVFFSVNKERHIKNKLIGNNSEMVKLNSLVLVQFISLRIFAY